MGRIRVEKNISFDEKRKLYYVTLNWGLDSDGKNRKTYVTARNKRDAQKILKEHIKARAAETAIAPTNELLADAVEAFIQYKELNLAQTTIYGYKNILYNHIRPYFKDKKLQSVKLQDIQNYQIAKRKSLSARTIQKHLDLLNSVFEDAKRKELIHVNPISLLEPMRTNTNKSECMDSTEIAQLLASVVDTKLELPVTLAVYLGLRRGEVLGLRWTDIDMEHGTLRIENTRTKAGGTVIEKDPKSEKSRRAFRIPAEVKAVLLKMQTKQQELKKTKRRYTESGYVFTKEDGSPFAPNYLSDIFKEHLKAHAMRPIRFHDLRHSFASIANEAGISVSEISSTMGHSNIGVTYSVYTHEFISAHSAAAQAVAAKINEAKIPAKAC